MPKSLDAHYVHKLMKNDYQTKLNDNFHEYGDASETEEKHQGHDKYLFPYTAEEDHCGTQTATYQPSRTFSPSLTNDVNNPGAMAEYQRQLGPGLAGSRMGSVMGSVMGSTCGSLRGSPSPLVAPMSGVVQTQDNE